MKYSESLNSIHKEAYVVVKNEVVVEISQSFIEMTEYSRREILNKDIRELFNILRIGPDIDEERFYENKEYFLFSRSLEARFVNINVKEDILEKVYFFYEKPNSRLNIKFPAIEALCSHNVFGIAVFSAPDITLLKANQTYLNFLDKPFDKQENSIGKKLQEVISGWIGSSSEDIWRNVLSTQKPIYIDEYMFEFERGVTYWEASLAPVFEDGILKYCVEITTEVTEKVLYRKKIEEQTRVIEQQKKLLQVIVDNYPDNIAVLDRSGNYIIRRNKFMKDIENQCSNIDDFYTIAKFYDSDGNEIAPEKQVGYRVLRGETVKDEIVAIKVMGREYYVLSYATPIYDEKGSFLYGVINDLDITELMKSQENLKETQEKLLTMEREKNEALRKAIEMKDEFLSVISHEFKTPLNVISTAIQTLNLVYSDQMTDKIKTYLGTIRQNINRQLRLVNNLLDITRANAGKIKINKRNIDVVFLTKVITESVYEFASKKGVRITFDSKLTKKVIGIDDEKYERIILNLLSNAIKFSEAGKVILVSITSIKENVCVKVKDNGMGIPENKLDVIFERFGQVDSSLSRQAEGTGIGLSLVKKFAEALGGCVTVKSRLGKGTTFKVLLPDKRVKEEKNERQLMDLMNNNRLVQTTNIEFSDIYL